MDIPDTTNFMIAGYVVIFGTMMIYLASLILRFRKLRRDEQTLDEMDADIQKKG